MQGLNNSSIENAPGLIFEALKYYEEENKKAT